MSGYINNITNSIPQSGVAMATDTLFEDTMKINEYVTDTKPIPRKHQLVWYTITYISYVHLAAVYGFYLGLTSAMWPTIAFGLLMHTLSTLGITAGAHRLWTHKAYKAKLPLQILLMLCQSTANTHTLITWIRDHMLHHKYTDTEADPHNARRGFFYSHLGWLMVRKNPESRAKGKLLDLSELYANPVLRFQQTYAVPLIASLAFIVPSLVPLTWGESLPVAYHMNILRVTAILNASSSINSVTHLWGTRPYDKSIMAVQNKIASFFAMGEGYHNFHHVFPQDYRTSEIGDFNMTTRFIDFCAWSGQAFDLRSVAEDAVKARMERTGDKMKQD